MSKLLYVSSLLNQSQNATVCSLLQFTRFSDGNRVTKMSNSTWMLSDVQAYDTGAIACYDSADVTLQDMSIYLYVYGQFLYNHMSVEWRFHDSLQSLVVKFTKPLALRNDTKFEQLDFSVFVILNCVGFLRFDVKF